MFLDVHASFGSALGHGTTQSISLGESAELALFPFGTCKVLATLLALIKPRLLPVANSMHAKQKVSATGLAANAQNRRETTTKALRRMVTLAKT